MKVPNCTAEDKMTVSHFLGCGTRCFGIQQENDAPMGKCFKTDLESHSSAAFPSRSV